MNNAPRLALRKIIAKYGNDLASDRRRVEGLLKDLCGEYRREINVLTSALEERIPLDLLAANKSTPREVLLTRLAIRLEDNLGLTPEAARWAVDSWALALGILTDAEAAEKEKKQSETLPPHTKPIQTTSAQNNRTVPPRGIPPTAQRPPQTSPNKPPPNIYPPAARPPANLPTPAPKSQPQRQLPSGSQIDFPQNPAQSNSQIQSAAPKKRFSKFFGCLFVLFLLVTTGIVLLFGVPYAIEVMRETQRTEPRRFPAQ
ncbi:MAG TPA: hypothetical protein VNI84_11300 [Pyrinomonadaceae bacterium]|nr:hypothetical protein [Pyrinomonadaceae bacterium]